jgi:hypothetical protein
MGYVMDRRVGNSGGLGGAFGLLWAVGETPVKPMAATPKQAGCCTPGGGSWHLLRVRLKERAGLETFAYPSRTSPTLHCYCRRRFPIPRGPAVGSQLAAAGKSLAAGTKLPP